MMKNKCESGPDDKGLKRYINLFHYITYNKCERKCRDIITVIIVTWFAAVAMC